MKPPSVSVDNDNRLAADLTGMTHRPGYDAIAATSGAERAVQLPEPAPPDLEFRLSGQKMSRLPACEIDYLCAAPIQKLIDASALQMPNEIAPSPRNSTHVQPGDPDWPTRVFDTLDEAVHITNKHQLILSMNTRDRAMIDRSRLDASANFIGPAFRTDQEQPDKDDGIEPLSEMPVTPSMDGRECMPVLGKPAACVKTYPTKMIFLHNSKE